MKGDKFSASFRLSILAMQTLQNEFQEASKLPLIFPLEFFFFNFERNFI